MKQQISSMLELQDSMNSKVKADWREQNRFGAPPRRYCRDVVFEPVLRRQAQGHACQAEK